MVVEGQTEEEFVNTVLGPALAERDIFADVHAITTGRRRGRPDRGGGGSYALLRGDLLRWMRQDGGPECWFTSMIDLYGLPRDFPGLAGAPTAAYARVAWLEARWEEDIAAAAPDLAAVRRFVPYVQLHEFEALLFADPSALLVAFPGQDKMIARLQAIRDDCGGPEAIDDGPSTAPSKRIAAVLPGYGKVTAGVLMAQRIGLARMRGECPHFAAWIGRLMALGRATE